MKTKKLTLNELKVNSFVTKFESAANIKGGTDPASHQDNEGSCGMGPFLCRNDILTNPQFCA